MKIARVLTNETCNQNCTFCSTRRPEERRDFVRREAVLARIERAADSGAEELTLAGGEPTLRADLADLIAQAKRAGFRSVLVETNAATIDAERAALLARAGLERARVKLVAWGAAADAITQDPGGFEATLRGMRALSQAGVRLEPVLMLARVNAAQAEQVPQGLKASGLPFDVLQIAVVTEASNADEVLALNDAASVVERVANAARSAGIAVRLDPGSAIPPCAFAEPGRVAHLFSLGRGGGSREGHVRIDACTKCVVNDRCPGAPSRALEGSPGFRPTPISAERVRRRLSLVASPAEQIEREVVAHELCRLPDGTAYPVRTVRINFHCNQACDFCFVSTHLPSAGDERIQQAIRDAGEVGAILALSGGEPTLNPRLIDYVRLGKASGVREVELQTNATRLAEDGLAARLVAAGVDVAFVSLHGPTAEISDAVTRAPGTFELTCAGLDAGRRAGLRLRLNFVFCERNRQSFPNVVALIAERWPSAALAVSFVAPSTDLVPRERWLIPRYTDVLPSLIEGVRLARERGIAITGFESMCGIPLCLVPVELRARFELAELPEGLDAGEFVKPEPCSRCSISARCWGLRRGYAEIYGASELAPLSESA